MKNLKRLRKKQLKLIQNELIFLRKCELQNIIPQGTSKYIAELCQNLLPIIETPEISLHWWERFVFPSLAKITLEKYNYIEHSKSFVVSSVGVILFADMLISAGVKKI